MHKTIIDGRQQVKDKMLGKFETSTLLSRQNACQKRNISAHRRPKERMQDRPPSIVCSTVVD